MTPDTVLVRAPDLELVLDARGDVRVRTALGTAVFPPSALALLDAFGAPRAVGEVLGAVVVRGSEHFLDASSALLAMHEAGVLTEPGVTPKPRPRGFGAPAIHVAMLDDTPRTSGFTRALRAVVRPGDAVIDVGTGTGVLAAVAALAGARKVYALESSGIAEVAREVFAKNDVADRVELVQARSQRVALPERCDVLVAELIGNDPLDEDLLEVIRDAHERLLAPGARVVPSELAIFAVPVDVPEDHFARIAFTDEAIARWTRATGVDLSPLAGRRLGPSDPATVRPRDAAAFPRVAAPVLLARIDLTRAPETALETTVDVAIARDASRLGVMLTFAATLAPGISLSTALDERDPSSHWRYALWPAWPRLRARAGETLRVTWRRRTGRTELVFE